MIKPDYNKNLFPHWTTMPVRYRDIDPLKHVNNAIYCTIYEEARVAFIMEIAAFRESMDDGFSFVLANINIDYVRPVEYPATLLIGNGIKKVGNSSITSFQAIYEEESKELVSVAEASGVWFDVEKHRPAPVPDIKNMDQFIIDG